MAKEKKNWLQRFIAGGPGVTEMSSAPVAIYRPPSPDVMEKVLLTGDLGTLTPQQRLSYYESVCRSLGLNPLTKPFEYIVLNNKLTLYARKDCTEQLRRSYNISLTILSREIADGLVTVTARAQMPNGRQDESVGSVFLPSSGEARANAIMKAETKAKRRVTLSICGLGMFDESEMEQAGAENPAASAKDRVEQATANRLADHAPAPEIQEPVTKENHGEVVCHIGKAEGNMLGKRVSEIHPKILSWLQQHYGDGENTPRWGNPPSPRDERLKAAVDIALRKLEEQ